ncbi:hypothetical protein N7534_007840 [Penicillium rubens]|nr:hypothetical protein N7534_007840 [Penicillium rubens]
MLLLSEQIAIVVLTNWISQGDIADWVAQTLLQALLDPTTTIDLPPVGQEATKIWRAGYRKVAETLEKEEYPSAIRQRAHRKGL